MKQKTSVKHSSRPAMPRYPYIGTHIDNYEFVVFFNAPGTGMCLSSKYQEDPALGEYSDKWSEEEFLHLNGFITLEQEA